MVARELGTSVSALIAANSHKPTAVVAGKRTFKTLRYNELLHKPGVGVGALGEDGTLGAITPADPAAPHALIASGSSGPDVALWQKIIGVKVDGSFGSGTAAATKTWQSAHGLNNDGVVGPNTWAKALGNASSAPVSVSTPVAAGASLAMAAGAAYTALNQDPNYCTSVARAGTPVNTAVHNFKAAWNAAYPGQTVPIGTGKYEPSVSAALSSALGGVAVPAGCGAGAAPQPSPAAAPSAPAPMPAPSVTPVPTPAPTASSAYSSAQIAAATAMNSALAAHGYKQADQGLYMAFQRAMGLTADGYPGTGTMGKLRAVLTSAGIPMASVPVYPWRAGAYDGVNAPTAASWTGAAATPAPPPPPSAPPSAPPGGGAAPAPSAPSAPSAGGGTLPVAPTPGGITPPEAKKGLSTGAIVVGAIGAAALIGLGAMALTGKKTGRRGARGARGPSRRKSSKHKPAHHAHPAHPKRKRKSKKK
jgi:peptidoglycan hydrolase-like protein with peptidoglycan-binding domain